MVTTPNVRPGMAAKQRRSQRILLAVPLRVTGKRSNGAAFTEKHLDAARECAWRIDFAEGSGAERGDSKYPESENRRRDSLYSGGCQRRGEWNGRDRRRVCATQFEILARLVSTIGLESAESRGQAIRGRLETRGRSSEKPRGEAHRCQARGDSFIDSSHR